MFTFEVLTLAHFIFNFSFIHYDLSLLNEQLTFKKF